MTIDEKILETVKQMPGSKSAEIALLADIKLNSVSSRITRLVATGALRREGKMIFLGSGEAQKAPVSKKLRMKPTTKMNLRIQELEAEVHELECWKEDAIRRYPDLSVKPEILAARKIIAKVFSDQQDHTKAREAMAGNLDKSPIMQVALLAAGS